MKYVGLQVKYAMFSVSLCLAKIPACQAWAQQHSSAAFIEFSFVIQREARGLKFSWNHLSPVTMFVFISAVNQQIICMAKDTKQLYQILAAEGDVQIC